MGPSSMIGYIASMLTNFATLEADPQAETGRKVLSPNTGLEGFKYDISCTPNYYMHKNLKHI